MPYLKGTAPTFSAMIEKLVSWVSDVSVHGEEAWEVMRSEPWPRGTLLKAHGLQKGEHLYVGLMTQKFVVGKTYLDWFSQPETVYKHFVEPVLNCRSFSQSGTSVSAYADAWTNPTIEENIRQIQLQIAKLQVQGGADATAKIVALQGAAQGLAASRIKPVSGSFGGLEIFSRNSQALFFGVFKQYCNALNWHEQPGALQPQFKPMTGFISLENSPRVPFSPPLYPGVGFPAIGWDYEDPGDDYPLKFWFIKDRSRLTVVVNKDDYWDMAHAGLLAPHNAAMEYAFPAVIAGGTSGAYVKGIVDRYNGDQVGTLFDFSTKNLTLHRGLPSFAACPEDSANALSQLAVMLPDGQWQYVANWQQGVQAVSTGINSYAYAVSEPKRTSRFSYALHPTNLDLRDVMPAIPTTENIANYQLEPLEVVQNLAASKNMLGRLKNVFWPSPPIYRYGEVRIGKKKHLIFPSGRENRRWFNPPHIDMVYDYETLEEIERQLAQLSKQTNCVVRLED